MKIAVVTTGNEILSGNIVNTNSSWISDRCWMLGYEVVLHISVRDNRDDIVDALKAASSKTDIVFVSGGLGATVDDITMDAAAEFFGRKLVFSESVWNEIITLFGDEKCTGNNRKQACVPEGADILRNRIGTAPGVKVKNGDKYFIFLPGVPKEMRGIFNDELEVWLREKIGKVGYSQKFLKLFGLPEATFDSLISDVNFGNVEFSFRVFFPEIWIKLVAREREEKAAVKQLRRVVGAIREKVGEYIYGEDEESLAEIVGDILVKKGYKLALAESCTGGLVSSKITDVPGSSRYLDRSFITYSNESKTELLGVDEDIIKRHGAVSEETALKMAEGALKNSGADIAASVTGIAGPSGGTDKKPVGTVHIVVTGEKGVFHNRYCYKCDRVLFKELVSHTVMYMIWKYIRD